MNNMARGWFTATPQINSCVEGMNIAWIVYNSKLKVGASLVQHWLLDNGGQRQCSAHNPVHCLWAVVKKRKEEINSRAENRGNWDFWDSRRSALERECRSWPWIEGGSLSPLRREKEKVCLGKKAVGCMWVGGGVPIWWQHIPKETWDKIISWWWRRQRGREYWPKKRRYDIIILENVKANCGVYAEK